MQEIFDTMMSNPMYIAIAGGLGLFTLLFLLKKLFKLAMIVILIIAVYAGYLYMTEPDPAKAFQEKLEEGKSTLNDLDDASQDMRKEAVDKIIDEMENKLKDAAKKK